MKIIYLFLATIFLFILTFNLTYATTTIPANDPNIQYFGRWDFTNPLAPAHSWPGVYVCTVFEGTSIGVRINDNWCYYNVTIDDSINFIFHGTVSGANSYTLRTGLPDGHHTIRFAKRDETNWTSFTFYGFVLDDGKSLLPPTAAPQRKIEFIGDSFTCAAGNEWTSNDTQPPDESYTNIDEGFGPIIARHYGAQYHMTSISGYGLVLDWQGNYANNLPDRFDRALGYTNLPKWDFEQWIPNLVVICLGLNDYNGWNGYTIGTLPEDEKDLFESRYHDYISWIRLVYPGVKILAVAPHPDWLQSTISEVVDQEKSMGNTDVFYGMFPYYPGGYVNIGHPTVATHHKIADTLVTFIDKFNPWQQYIDTIPPAFVHLPVSPFTVCSASYALNLETDEYATVRYSAHDTTYANMENQFTTTGKRNHSVTLNCLPGQNYIYYIRAMDLAGNTSHSSVVIQFNVDTSKSVLTWKSPTFDDSKWKTGAAPLGADSSAGNNTLLAHVQTSYFRKKVVVDNVDSTNGLSLNIKCNDGYVVYINGKELKRKNLATRGEITFDMFANSASNLNDSLSMTSANKNLNLWENGTNVIAVEVHSNNTNACLSFDSKLVDSKGNSYYAYGSSWLYDDEGAAPQDQAGAKTTGVLANNNVVDRFQLYQNYPNPFNPATIVRYQLGGNGSRFNVSLKVFDVLGQEVATLVNGVEDKGFHQITWNASKYGSGIYFVRLNSRDQSGKLSTQSMKMILMK